MDSRPFFMFNILDFQDHQLSELKKFTKSAFSLDDILTTASTLKYTGAIKKILESELSEPSEDFVRFFASRVFDGRLTKPVMDNFTRIVLDARKQFINEKINERLSSALSVGDSQPVVVSTPDEDNAVTQVAYNGIITLDEEIEGFNIVKAILRQNVDVKRVIMRDTKSYCGILLDDNNRKPICRLHFNYSQKYLGVLKNKEETRIEIENVDDIFNYSDQIISTLMEYE